MMEINGSCHCGKIIFESIIDPMKVRICHCIDCQKLSGTAFRVTVMSEPDGVIFTKGKAKEYIKIAGNGNRRAQGFCQHCGSSLYATTEETSNRIYGIRVGTLEQRHELTPCFQTWQCSAVPWLKNINSLPKF
tara:strand:+ start:313 stop:711 length:399 start_codon:yes stop_codon:yes gene_type:complete